MSEETASTTRSKKAKASAEDAATALSFEESARRLTAIVEELEGGELPLERSLELFEEGIKLARSAKSRLDRAEKRVEELLAVDGQGKPVVRDFEG
jgi:exodeoxyribonuclease VII small subunit